MTRQRAIAATDTQIHIHHEHIGSVYDSGFNLLGYRRQPPLIRERVHANIVVRARELGKGSMKGLAKLFIIAQQGKWNFQNLGSGEHGSCVMPFLLTLQSFQSEAVACA